MRTLPGHPFFLVEPPPPGRDSIVGAPGAGKDEKKMQGCLMLGRILQAVALSCPQVGYCQGMNFVAVTLLLCALPEHVSGGLDEDEEGGDSKRRKRGESEYMDDDDDDEEEEEEKDCSAGEGEGPKSRISGTSVDINVLTESRLSEAETVVTDTCIGTGTGNATFLPNSSPSAAAAAPAAWGEKDRLQTEFRVYLFMCRLVHRGGKHGMLGLWQNGTPRMKLRVFQLDRIMTWRLPRLKAHFDKIQLQPEILVSQWFMTIFSYTTPLKLTMRIWDFIVLGGWPAMYQIAFALLASMESRMRVLDLDGIGKLMRDWKQSGNSMLRADQESLRDVLKEASGMQFYVCVCNRCVRVHVCILCAIIVYTDLNSPHTIIIGTIITDRLLRQLEDNYALEMISMSEVSLAAAKARKREEELSAAAGPMVFTNSSNISFPKSSHKTAVTAAGAGVSSVVTASSSPGSDTSTPSTRFKSKDKSKDTYDQLREDSTATTATAAAEILDSMLATANGVLEKGISLVTPADPPKPTLGALTGREATNWLLRYGAILTEDMSLDMLRVRDELCSLEVRTELDKQKLQQKILHSCEAVRSSEADIEEADRLMLRFMEKIESLDERLKRTISAAETLSKAVLGVEIGVNALNPGEEEEDEEEDDDTAVAEAKAKLSAVTAKARLTRISEEVEEDNSRPNSEVGPAAAYMLRGFAAATDDEHDDWDKSVDEGMNRTSSDGTAAAASSELSKFSTHYELSPSASPTSSSTSSVSPASATPASELSSSDTDHALSPLKPGNQPLLESDYEVKITTTPTAPGGGGDSVGGRWAGGTWIPGSPSHAPVIYFAGDMEEEEAPPSAPASDASPSPTTQGRKRDFLRASFNSFFGSSAESNTHDSGSGSGSGSGDKGEKEGLSSTNKEGNCSNGSSSSSSSSNRSQKHPQSPASTSKDEEKKGLPSTPRKSTSYRAAAIAHIGSVFTTITTAGGLLGSGSKKMTSAEVEEEARVMRAAKAEAEMQRLSDESQRCQQLIIRTTRALTKAKQRLVQTTQWKAAGGTA